ncbi:MAG: Uma2 family endonuclease [Luteolibacter sp.]
MTAVKPPDFITLEDYLAGEEVSAVKHEYLGGTVHAMAGATNQHNTLAGNSFASLHGQLRRKTCQPFNSDTKVRIEFTDHTRLYYSDAMVVCDSRSATEYFQDRPVVIIEVLTDSTRRTDLGEKRDAYLTMPSLKLLLFIEPESPTVIAYRRKPEGGFAAEPYSGLAAVVPLQEIEASLPLADLYERVELKA